MSAMEPCSSPVVVNTFLPRTLSSRSTSSRRPGCADASISESVVRITTASLPKLDTSSIGMTFEPDMKPPSDTTSATSCRPSGSSTMSRTLSSLTPSSSDRISLPMTDLPLSTMSPPSARQQVQEVHEGEQSDQDHRAHHERHSHVGALALEPHAKSPLTVSMSKGRDATHVAPVRSRGGWTRVCRTHCNGRGGDWPFGILPPDVRTLQMVDDQAPEGRE